MIERNKKRRWTLIITIFDFIIIFMFIFYLNSYLLNIKVIKDNGLKIKFKFIPLKENLGIMFNLSIENISDKKKVIKILVFL